MEISMKNYKSQFILSAGIAYCLLLSLDCRAQKAPSEYQALYANEYAVSLNENTKTSIALKRGELEITETIQRSRLLMDKRASGHAKVSLEYDPAFSRIEDVEAYTLVPNAAKDDYDRIKVRDISDQKLLSDDVFHDGTRAKVFQFPSVQKGAITVMNYTRHILDPHLLGSEIFQGYQRVEQQDFILEYDEAVDMDIRYFNCKEQDFIYTVVEKGGKKIHHWRSRNLDKLKDESMMPAPLSLIPHIVYRIRSYEYKGQTYPVLRDVNDLHEQYKGFIKDVRKESSPAIARLADSLVTGVDDPRQKAALIFKWMQENVRYIAFEEGTGGFIPRPPALVFDRRFGDCKDMSCLMIAMLNQVEVPAYHTWIGTRKLPYSYHEVPSTMTDNHMIATVVIDNELIFLDATSEHLPYPLPSSFIQGKEALIGYSEDSFKIATVPVVSALSNLNSDSLMLQLEGSRLSGSGRRSYHGYYAEMINAIGSRNDQKAVKEQLESHVTKGSNKCRSSNFKVAREPEQSHITYDIDIPGYAYQSDDALYINLNLEKLMAEASLEDDRSHPLEHDYCFALQRHFILAVPEGYRVDYLPQGMDFHSEDVSASISYLQSGDQLHYYLNIELKSLQIGPEGFDNFNQMIKELNRQYQETITLRKI